MKKLDLLKIIKIYIRKKKMSKINYFENDCGENAKEMDEVNSTTNIQRSGVIIKKVKRDFDEKVTASSEHCALKIVDHTNKGLLSSLKQEAEILNKLNHENIVKFYGSSTEGETSFIIMEWMEKDLQRLINEKISSKQIFAKTEIEHILKCLLGGLFFLRSKRIFHGDLKPSNILYDGKTYKLGDFGNSKDFNSLNENVYGSYFIGTPNYWPPEIRNAFLRNDEKTNFNVFKVDSFSLGFLVLCTCTLLPPAEIHDLLSDKIKRKKMFLEIREIYGEGVMEMLLKMMRSDYLKRDSVLFACLNYSKESKKIVKEIVLQHIGLKRKVKEKFEFVGNYYGNEEKSLVLSKKKKNGYIMIKKTNIKEDILFKMLVKFSFNFKQIMQYQFYDIRKMRNEVYELMLFCNLEGKLSFNDDLLNRQKLNQTYTILELTEILIKIITILNYFRKLNVGFLFNLDIHSIFKRKNDILLFVNEEECKINNNDEVMDLGIFLLSLSTLKKTERNGMLEETQKELYFFNEPNIEFILKHYGEDFMYILMEMIRFNENKRITLPLLLSRLEELKLKCH